jgi:hypothetical protein
MRANLIILFTLLTFNTALSSPSFPKYGHWCGSNNPRIDRVPYPIDKIDDICMRHNICRINTDHLNRHCDLSLLEELELIDDMELDYFQFHIKRNLVSHFQNI